MVRSRQRAEEPRRLLRRSARTQNLPTEELAARLVTIIDPPSAASEAYRTLRTNLIYSLVDTPAKVIVLTSPGAREGKSTICANLGVVLSQATKRILIVDCDLRKPVMHKFFGLRNLHGVGDILVGERTLQETANEPVPGLKVVSAGLTPPDPTELLGTQRLTDFLSDMRRQFDFVLVDAPPVGLVSDSAILATQGDGVLLVLDAQKTRKGSVGQVLRNLKAVGANMLGTVVNNVDISKNSYNSYTGYGYR
jgi:capsular exopolysaccharide synthesis family protein